MIEQNLGNKIIELSEAHLLNVQREIQNLEARKNELEEQISSLKNYLTEAAEDVTIAKEQNIKVGTTVDPQSNQDGNLVGH